MWRNKSLTLKRTNRPSQGHAPYFYSTHAQDDNFNTITLSTMRKPINNKFSTAFGKKTFHNTSAAPNYDTAYIKNPTPQHPNKIIQLITLLNNNRVYFDKRSTLLIKRNCFALLSRCFPSNTCTRS